jgi:hypothetical protein
VRGGASSQGAIATTEDRGERKGSCGSEVEEFDADATGGGGGRGWSREAHEKVTRRGFFAVMSTNMCNVKRTIAQQCCSVFGFEPVVHVLHSGQAPDRSCRRDFAEQISR